MCARTLLAREGLGRRFIDVIIPYTNQTSESVAIVHSFEAMIRDDQTDTVRKTKTLSYEN